MHCTQHSHKTLNSRVFQKSAAMWLFLKVLHLSERHQLILCSMEYQHRLRQAAWLPECLCKRNFSCKAANFTRHSTPAGYLAQVSQVCLPPVPFAPGWASPRARKIGDSSSNVSFPKRSCSAKVPSHVPQERGKSASSCKFACEFHRFRERKQAETVPIHHSSRREIYESGFFPTFHFVCFGTPSSLLPAFPKLEVQYRIEEKKPQQLSSKHSK